jgi:uncharacterized protein (DUF169 family)
VTLKGAKCTGKRYREEGCIVEQDLLKAISEEYRTSLNLEGFPAAVKMVETLEMLEGIKYKGRSVRIVDKKLMICQLISQARFYGRVVAGISGNLSLCRLGADAMGFEVDDYTHVYAGTYFSSKKAATKMIAEMPKLERNKYAAVVVGPLDRMPVEPDVVVIYGNVSQMLRIINGYLFDTGDRLAFSTSGDAGLCADTVAMPMLTGRPHLSVPCNGGRIMSLPNQTEMACGIPFAELEHILEGIKFTGRNVPVMYPSAWQHIAWEPPADSPIYAFVRPEERKKNE